MTRRGPFRAAVLHLLSERLPGRVRGLSECRDRVESVMVGAVHEHPYSILVADDDRAARDALRAIIDPLGYRTLLASDGAEALEIVHQEIIHAALFDVHMPNLTGLEALQMLRQFNPELPVILITADSSAGLMRQAFQAHAYSVLPKPVNKNMVLHTLSRALGKSHGDRLH